MLEQQTANHLQPGVPVTVLARLREADVSDWHYVGTVMRPRSGKTPITIRLEKEALLLEPVWEAALEGPLPHTIPVWVEFAIVREGHTTRIAECQITRGLAREVEDRAPRLRKPLGGGPRPLRSSWPSEAFFAAIRRY